MRREPWQWLRFAPWKKEDSKAKCIYRGPIQKIQQPEFLSLEVRNNNKSSRKWNCYWVCQSCNLYLKEGSFINDFKAGDSTQNPILVNLMYLYKLIFIIELSLRPGDRSKGNKKTGSFQAYQLSSYMIEPWTTHPLHGKPNLKFFGCDIFCFCQR